jgi:hypothetical protein
MKLRDLFSWIILTCFVNANVPLSVPLQNGIGPADDLLLFDAPAFPDPSKPGEYLVDQPTFVFKRRGRHFSESFSTLSTFDDEAAQSVNRMWDRLQFFMAVGLPNKSTTLSVSNCSRSPHTGPTALYPALGVSLAKISLGSCGENKELTGIANLAPSDSRRMTNTIFLSPDSGFGVISGNWLPSFPKSMLTRISDIDDTIKISNVLDKFELLRNTFLVDPQPVAGIPQLYASLARSLGDPQFVYISASPFQLYPFLNNFIDTTYAASRGPVFLQNVTMSNPTAIINFLTSEQKIFEYKVSQIDRLQVMYPNKKWLAIGDSAQKDPETYGEACVIPCAFLFPKFNSLSSFRKFPSFIACIWIRLFDSANNTDARFQAAFAGVPANKYRLFTDAEIPNLSGINVAAGEC